MFVTTSFMLFKYANNHWNKGNPLFKSKWSHGKTGNKNCASCFATLLQNELKSGCCAFYHPRSNLLTTWFVAWQVWMWVVKRVILLFHSFCSNVAKQVAWFCYTFYRRVGAPWVNKLQFTKNLQYFLLLTLYREQNKLHIFVEPQKSNGFRQKLIRTRWNVSVRARSNWKLKVLVFKERGKPEYLENNLSE